MGHAYFLDHKGKPGSVFKHMWQSLKTGRVRANPDRMFELPKNYKP